MQFFNHNFTLINFQDNSPLSQSLTNNPWLVGGREVYTMKLIFIHCKVFNHSTMLSSLSFNQEGFQESFAGKFLKEYFVLQFAFAIALVSPVKDILVSCTGANSVQYFQ